MEKQKTKRMPIIAWIFIILNILTVILIKPSVTQYSFLSKASLFLLGCYMLIYSLAGIYVGIYVLKRKEWARKSIIVLAILGLLDFIVIGPLNHKVVNNQQFEEKPISTLEKQYNTLPEKSKQQLTEEKFIETSIFITRIIGHVFIGIIELILAAYMIIIIVYFKKNIVKEQFKINII